CRHLQSRKVPARVQEHPISDLKDFGHYYLFRHSSEGRPASLDLSNRGYTRASPGPGCSQMRQASATRHRKQQRSELARTALLAGLLQGWRLRQRPPIKSESASSQERRPLASEPSLEESSFSLFSILV